MKKVWLSVVCMLVIGSLLLTGVGCSFGDSGDPNELGDYRVEIKDCRLAKDDSGKDLIIIQFGFTNNSDDPTAFLYAFAYEAFQNGIGLTEVMEETIKAADYTDADQVREIKKGTSLDVEVAYELNDTDTPVEVEVSELISFSDKKVTKTFTIQ